MKQQPDHALAKWAFACFFAGAVWLWLIFAIGCGYAEHRDPPIIVSATPRAAQLAADLQAKEATGRWVSQINCCGSMKPLIQDGDWVVIEPAPFTDDLLGRVCLYRRPKDDPKFGGIVHRYVSGDIKDGFIASGDANARSESWAPVRADRHVGVVIAIHRSAP